MWLITGCRFGCSSRNDLVYSRPQMMGSIILSSAHAHSVFCHSRILLTPGMCRSALSCSACMVLLHGHSCRHRRWGFLVGLSPGTMQDMLPAFACCRFFSPYGFTLKPSPRRSGCRLPCASNSSCPLLCCKSGSCKPPMQAPRMAVAHPRVAMKRRRANRHFAVLPSRETPTCTRPPFGQRKATTANCNARNDRCRGAKRPLCGGAVRLHAAHADSDGSVLPRLRQPSARPPHTFTAIQDKQTQDKQTNH